MGLRETLNENPAITTRVTLVVLLFAIGIIVWQLLPPPKQIPKDFYTIDDGKTTFVDNAAKVSPFPARRQTGRPRQGLHQRREG